MSYALSPLPQLRPTAAQVQRAQVWADFTARQDQPAPREAVAGTWESIDAHLSQAANEALSVCFMPPGVAQAPLTPAQALERFPELADWMLTAKPGDWLQIGPYTSNGMRCIPASAFGPAMQAHRFYQQKPAGLAMPAVHPEDELVAEHLRNGGTL